MSDPKPSTCPICNGFGWVCESHVDQPWEHDGCGGAGVPCVCNREAKMRWREVYADVDDTPIQRVARRFWLWLRKLLGL